MTVTPEDTQLALVDVQPEPPKLTDRQQQIFDAVVRAGVDGLLAEEAGAIDCERRGRHTRDERCMWDGANGKELLEALKAKELVRYRRAKGGNPGAWFTTAALEDDGSHPPGMTDTIPY